MAHTKETHSATHGHADHAPGATHEAVVHDPEQDIDGRSAALYVVIGSIVFFVSFALMLPIFTRVQEAEHNRKVSNVPNTELDDVRQAERQFLGGQNPTKKTIEQVLQQMAGK